MAYRAAQLAPQAVNPVYRDLDGKVRSHLGKLNRMLASFGAMHFEETLDDEKLNPFLQKKSGLARRD